ADAAAARGSKTDEEDEPSRCAHAHANRWVPRASARDDADVPSILAASGDLQSGTLPGATCRVHATVLVGEHVIESVLTRRSAEELALRKGDQATAVVKSHRGDAGQGLAVDASAIRGGTSTAIPPATNFRPAFGFRRAAPNLVGDPASRGHAIRASSGWRSSTSADADRTSGRIRDGYVRAGRCARRNERIWRTAKG